MFGVVTTKERLWFFKTQRLVTCDRLIVKAGITIYYFYLFFSYVYVLCLNKS